jgi:hypothetical protein
LVCQSILSYQGKDTDLFIDLHPPKNFSSSAASLFNILCNANWINGLSDLFGYFYKQISKKRISYRIAWFRKTLLIQSIAGETELKMITDSAIVMQWFIV